MKEPCEIAEEYARQALTYEQAQFASNPYLSAYGILISALATRIPANLEEVRLLLRTHHAFSAVLLFILCILGTGLAALAFIMQTAPVHLGKLEATAIDEQVEEFRITYENQVNEEEDFQSGSEEASQQVSRSMLIGSGAVMRKAAKRYRKLNVDRRMFQRFTFAGIFLAALGTGWAYMGTFR